MSYQSLKNGKVITWPDSNDIQSINTDLLQLKNDLDALKSKVSTEAEQQDSYYGRNIKTVTEQVGSSTLSPYLDDTNALLMSALSAGAQTFYVENIQGLHINCNYFISNAATCDEILVKNITTDFNNYDSTEDSIYKIGVDKKIPNDYAINQASVIRTNIPTRNNKAYDAYDTLVNDVDTFFMESTLATLQVPAQIGLYNTTKSTSDSDVIMDYSLECYHNMPRLTLNRFVDVGHIVDPYDKKQLKFSGTTTIDRFGINVYVRTFACHYNEDDYVGINGRTQQKVSREYDNKNNFDPFLVLRQTIVDGNANSSKIRYFFTDYRTVAPPTGTTAWTDTTGSLVDLDTIPGDDPYIFYHMEFLTVSYTRRVIAGTTNKPTSDTPNTDIDTQTIPFGDYSKITVQLSNPNSNDTKIYCDKSKTLYINKQLYTGIKFYYNNDPSDVVTRTVSAPRIIQDNHKTIGTTYYLVFETMQEAVGKKAYRLYVNSNLTSENFVKHGDVTSYNATATNTSQFMNGINVRVVPASDMLYGDQPCGTIYTRPITLSSEAISKFSLYCSLYRNDLTSVLQESVDANTNEKITEFFLNTYVSFDKRIKKRKNISLYPKVPYLYSGAHYHHGQRHRAATNETTAKDGTNGACFVWDAASWRPFTYKKQEAHPEQLSLDASRSDWECLLDYVLVRIEQQSGSSSITLVTITVYPKSMKVKCSTTSGITINKTATVPTGIDRIDGANNYEATYVIQNGNSSTFLQTYQQANAYNDHRYYYNLVGNTTGIKVIKSTTDNRCTITFSHISTAGTEYSYTSITPYVKFAIPLYLFGRISDVGTAQVMLDGVQTSIVPLTNVISSSIILTLMRNGEPYEYSSLVYTPRATTTFTAPGTVSGTLTLTFTEKDDIDKIDNKTVVKFTIDGTTVKNVSVQETTITTSKTFNPTGTISGTENDKKIVLGQISPESGRKIDIVVTLSTTTSNSVTTTTTTLTETISYGSMTFIKTFTDKHKSNATTATVTVQFQKKYKGMPIPRVAAYNVNNKEVPNWYFFNGYNYKSDNKVDTSLRLNGIVMSTVLPPNVEVISSYDYYEDVCKEENWIPMRLEPNLMHIDDAFSKTTSSCVLSEDNLQSAKCKIQVSSSNKMQYFVFSCKTIAKTQIYVDNDNLENQNILKVTGQKEVGKAYLADSTQRLAGKAMIESPFAGEEISFLAKVSAIYSIPRIQNTITKKWEIPPRASRQVKGKLTDAVLKASYYVAIEEYITPPNCNAAGDNQYEINCLTSTGSDQVTDTIDYVHSWGAYYAATASTKILPLRTMSEIDSPTTDVKNNGGYFWDPDRLQLTVYPPKDQNINRSYVRHLIPYSKAQAFITAMKNTKYCCFQPAAAGKESVWEAKDDNGEFILDFEPIIAVQVEKTTAQTPRCLKKMCDKVGDYKTIAVCMTWQDIPNIAGMNMAWTTKALNIQVEEETGEE